MEELLKGPYESSYPSIPEPWCDPRCPRQLSHFTKDCTCGGAELQHKFWVEQSKKGK